MILGNLHSAAKGKTLKTRLRSRFCSFPSGVCDKLPVPRDIFFVKPDHGRYLLLNVVRKVYCSLEIQLPLHLSYFPNEMVIIS